MDPEAALLEVIRDAPDDDAPRLALADWLMEQPDPGQQARGEFIAVQCRLARMEEYEPGWEALNARRASLEEESGSRWLGDSWVSTAFSWWYSTF